MYLYLYYLNCSLEVKNNNKKYRESNTDKYNFENQPI